MTLKIVVVTHDSLQLYSTPSLYNEYYLASWLIINGYKSDINWV